MCVHYVFFRLVTLTKNSSELYAWNDLFYMDKCFYDLQHFFWRCRSYMIWRVIHAQNFSICMKGCIFFEWHDVNPVKIKCEGMWQLMRVMGRNCSTILLNQREIHHKILLYFGLMEDLDAPVLMALSMSMVYMPSSYKFVHITFHYSNVVK